MDMQTVWDSFTQRLSNCPEIDSCNYRKIAGTPFLYITTTNQSYVRSSVEQLIERTSKMIIKETKLFSQTIFVREDPPLFVFRHRFYVPQQKMFCCGNLCIDCIRFLGEKI